MDVVRLTWVSLAATVLIVSPTKKGKAVWSGEGVISDRLGVYAPGMSSMAVPVQRRGEGVIAIVVIAGPTYR